MYLCAALRKLAIDIGNTRTKIGHFDHKLLQEKVVQPAFAAREIINAAHLFGADYLIISSVTTPDMNFVAALQSAFPVVELSANTPLPFINLYRTPQTLGKDRLAAVAGAQALYRGHHCLVIDAGTCIKYELLTDKGEYLGGNISPGLMMRTKAMAHFTARLPEVALSMPIDPIGNDTLTALQNGAFMGAVLEIEGFYSLFEMQLDAALKVIFTGGDAAFLAAFFDFEDQVIEPDLTLKGLNEILDLHISKQVTQ